MKIKEEILSVPLNQTTGVEGPKARLKIQTVSIKVLKRAAVLGTKKRVAEELNLIADVLVDEDNTQAVFLN